MTPKFHSLLVKEIRQETEDTVSVAFDVPTDIQSEYSFIAGQYLTLRSMINGEDVRRSYSLCSLPNSGEWRVAVKMIENGKFSTFINKSLKVGDKIDVMTPTGSFKLNPNSAASNSYVLFAAGSGITPILSILKSVLENEPNSDVTLFYGNRGFGSIIFREELEALKSLHMERLRVVHIFSRENPGSKIQKGRIDVDKTRELFNAFLSSQEIDGVYICGPEQMILDVKNALIDQGLDGSKIHFELFTSPTEAKEKIAMPTNSPKIESQVTIIIDGDEYEIPLSSTGINVLDAGHEAGADLPFACKGGVCCTCKAKIIEGSASMEVNYALEPDEVEAGYILTCQSHPTSEKLIVSFDE